MHSIKSTALTTLLLLIVSQRASEAANPVTWNIDIFTTGNDVFWTSPTAITLGLPEYDWSYEITELTATVTLLGEQDLLDQLGDAAMGSGTTNTPPLVLLDEVLNETTTGSMADIRIEIDANGFGQASGTDITLGGVGFLSVQRVDLKATVSIVGVPTGDYDRDGDIDAADYAIWKADFGSTANLAADGNDNNIVDAADYTVWRDHLGIGALEATSAAVPEPGTLALFLAIFALCASLRAVRRS